MWGIARSTRRRAVQALAKIRVAELAAAAGGAAELDRLHDLPRRRDLTHLAVVRVGDQRVAVGEALDVAEDDAPQAGLRRVRPDLARRERRALREAVLEHRRRVAARLVHED